MPTRSSHLSPMRHKLDANLEFVSLEHGIDLRKFSTDYL